MKQIFAAIIPGWKGHDLPAAFPVYVRLALRLSVLVVHIFAILKFARPFGLLPQHKREELIEILYNHPNAMVRNLVQWWKLTALMLQC